MSSGKKAFVRCASSPAIFHFYLNAFESFRDALCALFLGHSTSRFVMSDPMSAPTSFSPSRASTVAGFGFGVDYYRRLGEKKKKA